MNGGATTRPRGPIRNVNGRRRARRMLLAVAALVPAVVANGNISGPPLAAAAPTQPSTTTAALPTPTAPGWSGTVTVDEVVHIDAHDVDGLGDMIDSHYTVNYTLDGTLVTGETAPSGNGVDSWLAFQQYTSVDATATFNTVSNFGGTTVDTVTGSGDYQADRRADGPVFMIGARPDSLGDAVTIDLYSQSDPDVVQTVGTRNFCSPDFTQTPPVTICTLSDYSPLVGVQYRSIRVPVDDAAHTHSIDTTIVTNVQTADPDSFDTVTTTIHLTRPPDRDVDGIPDREDNCPDNTNPDQSDANSDGIGDACTGHVIITATFGAGTSELTTLTVLGPATVILGRGFPTTDADVPAGLSVWSLTPSPTGTTIAGVHCSDDPDSTGTTGTSGTISTNVDPGETVACTVDLVASQVGYIRVAAVFIDAFGSPQLTLDGTPSGVLDTTDTDTPELTVPAAPGDHQTSLSVRDGTGADVVISNITCDPAATPNPTNTSISFHVTAGETVSCTVTVRPNDALMTVLVHTTPATGAAAVLLSGALTGRAGDGGAIVHHGPTGQLQRRRHRAQRLGRRSCSLHRWHLA